MRYAIAIDDAAMLAQLPRQPLYAIFFAAPLMLRSTITMPPRCRDIRCCRYAVRYVVACLPLDTPDAAIISLQPLFSMPLSPMLLLPAITPFDFAY